MARKSDKTNEHLDAKDAMAAILAGCNGISDKQARRRVYWIMASGTDEQRKSLEDAMDGIQRHAPPGYGRADPETQRRMLRMMGRLIAKRYRRRGKRPPCDDPIARSKMLRIARFFFSPQKVDREFVPFVGHYIEELDEARAAGPLKVFIVKLGWWCAFAQHCGFDKWLALLDLAGKIVKLVL